VAVDVDNEYWLVVDYQPSCDVRDSIESSKMRSGIACACMHISLCCKQPLWDSQTNWAGGDLNFQRTSFRASPRRGPLHW